MPTGVVHTTSSWISAVLVLQGRAPAGQRVVARPRELGAQVVVGIGRVGRSGRAVVAGHDADGQAGVGGVRQDIVDAPLQRGAGLRPRPADRHHGGSLAGGVEHLVERVEEPDLGVVREVHDDLGVRCEGAHQLDVHRHLVGGPAGVGGLGRRHLAPGHGRHPLHEGGHIGDGLGSVGGTPDLDHGHGRHRTGGEEGHQVLRAEAATQLDDGDPLAGPGLVGELVALDEVGRRHRRARAPGRCHLDREGPDDGPVVEAEDPDHDTVQRRGRPEGTSTPRLRATRCRLVGPAVAECPPQVLRGSLDDDPGVVGGGLDHA